jgi:hypothetical protein
MNLSSRSIPVPSSSKLQLQPLSLHRPAVPASCQVRSSKLTELPSEQPCRSARRHVLCMAQNAVEAQTQTQPQAELPSCWDRVAPEQQQGWLEAAAELQGLGIPAEQAHQVLVKAFGWGSQGYWRHSKVDEPPTADQIRAVAAYLASLNIQVCRECLHQHVLQNLGVLRTRHRSCISVGCCGQTHSYSVPVGVVSQVKHSRVSAAAAAAAMQGDSLLKLVKTFPEVFGCR